jgi:hypothetical protein
MLLCYMHEQYLNIARTRAHTCSLTHSKKKDSLTHTKKKDNHMNRMHMYTTKKNPQIIIFSWYTNK